VEPSPAQHSKIDWILLFLNAMPLDRIHLMKALFLFWYRTGRQIEGFFRFKPYMYGPCSFDLYDELRASQQSHLVAQASHIPAKYARFHITDLGRKKAEEAESKTSASHRKLIKDIVNEVSNCGFKDLLQNVYTEAPEFTSNSVFNRR